MLTLTPPKALERVKRHLRRQCCKPTNMKVRTYIQHLLRVNYDEIPMLPPFRPQQSLTQDELLDIMLHGTPKSWEIEMDRQGFDPLLHTLPEVVNFMEGIELGMSSEADNKREDFKDLLAQKKVFAGHDPTKIPKGMQYCRYHGYGKHSSEMCYKLKAQAKRQKTHQPMARPSGAPMVTMPQVNLQIAAYVQQKIQEGVQNELASMDKKRRASPFKTSARAGASELLAFDLTMGEEVDEDGLEEDLLDGFNYEEMDNLPADDHTVV